MVVGILVISFLLDPGLFSGPFAFCLRECIRWKLDLMVGRWTFLWEWSLLRGHSLIFSYRSRLTQSPPLSQKQPAGLNRCTKLSGKLTWLNGKCTMNEAVFPIENGNNFIATLVFSSFKSFQVLSSPHLSEESIGKLAVWGGFGTDWWMVLLTLLKAHEKLPSQSCVQDHPTQPMDFWRAPAAFTINGGTTTCENLNAAPWEQREPHHWTNPLQRTTRKSRNRSCEMCEYTIQEPQDIVLARGILSKMTAHPFPAGRHLIFERSGDFKDKIIFPWKSLDHIRFDEISVMKTLYWVVNFWDPKDDCILLYLFWSPKTRGFFRYLELVLWLKPLQKNSVSLTTTTAIQSSKHHGVIYLGSWGGENDPRYTDKNEVPGAGFLI